MKKRILSLILALSMVLSVLPLGAFAGSSLPELVMQGGFPKDSNYGSNNCSGHNWAYMNGTLTLMGGEYDFTYADPTTKKTKANSAVKCPIEVESYVTITGGTFNATVGNGTWNRLGGTISNGIFNGGVTNSNTINNGTFNGQVANGGTIEKGTFNGEVENRGTIKDGTFAANKEVENYGTIKKGTFAGNVRNEGTIENGTFEDRVINEGTIENGIFEENVQNSMNGKISGGAFSSTVENNTNGTIANGTFKGSVTNWGDITGGTFAGSVKNQGTVTGGVFNLNVTPTVTTGGHNITWDKNYSEAEIKEVNGVAADWKPYVYAGTTVTITADTEIFSLNGKSIGDGNCKSSYGSNGLDKTTVTFTMPSGNVVLSTGELVMENGLPDITGMSATQDGSYTVYIGDGWKYSVKSGSTGTGTLYLNSGSYDFSYTKPKTKAGGSAEQPVQCDIKLASADVTITGGKFEYTVMNSNGGTISGGTFKSSVYSYNGHIIGGVFRGKTTSKPTQDAYTITLDTANAKITEVNGVSADWDPYPYVVVTASTQNQVVTITASTEIFSLNDKSIGAGNCNSSYGSGNNIVTFTMPDEPVVLSGAITCTNLVMKGGYPEASNGGTTPCKGNGWTYSKKDTSNPKGKLTLTDGTYDFSYTYPQNSNGAGAEPVACAVETQLRVEITGGTFEEEVINNDLGVISGGTFHEKVSNCNGMITGGTFKSSVTSKGHGRIFGGVFNGNATLTNVTGLHSITVASGAKIKEVNGMSADWDPYVVVTENATTNEVIITADTEIFSLNGKSIGDGNCKSSYDGSDYKTVKFTMPDTNVVLNGAITCTDLVMEKGWPQASNEGKISCSGTGWSYDHITKTLTLTSGEYDFSSTEPVQCAIQSSATITGGTFEKKVTNNAGGIISGGTFAGSVSNNGGTVNGGIFNGNTGLDGVTDLHSITWDAASSNAKIEKVNGVSADWAPYVVTSNATTKEVTITADTEIFSLNGQPIAESSYGVDKKTVTFTMPDDDVVLNGELITKPEPEPEPEPKPEPTPKPEPEPEPTTYTVTVIGGTIDGKTSVSAKENDTLTVVLDQSEIPDGMTFDMWSISSSKLSGDINVDYRAEAMPFKMPAEDVTIRAQYRSAEIIEDAAPSPLATAATIAVGGAAAGIVVWQGVSLGVDLYLANALPQGVPVPTDRRALALLLWETAGKPEVALPTLYGDIPAEEIELQKATRWAVQNGLMDAADKKDASFFDPDHYVTKMDVFGAWLRLKKLLGTT